MARAALAICIALLLSACEGRADLKTQRYWTGVYGQVGSEYSSILMVDVEGPVCPEFASTTARDMFMSAEPDDEHPLLLVMEGELSGIGRYGHLGSCRREIAITKIFQITKLSQDQNLFLRCLQQREPEPNLCSEFASRQRVAP